MIDNPSAGKFDPPPGAQERFEPPRPARRGAWIVFTLGAACLVVEQADRWWHPRGVWAVLALVGMSVLAGLQFAAHRTFEPEQNPYSEHQHVTR